MVAFLQSLKGNNCGASAAEYALILAVLGGITLAGATTAGQAITGVFAKGLTPLLGV